MLGRKFWFGICLLGVGLVQQLFAYEEDFSANRTTIPSGWSLGSTGAAYVTLTTSQPQMPEGTDEAGLGVNFYNATKGNLLKRTAKLAENVVCDTILAKLRIYVKPEDGLVDGFQVVVSTNNWVSYETIGEPIANEDPNREQPGWVTYSRQRTISGLLNSKCDLYVGILLTTPAGKSHDYGYIRSIELSTAAAATPTGIGLELDGEEVGDAALIPGDENVTMRVTVSPDPVDDRLHLEGVYGVVDRDGAVSTNQLVRVEGTYEYTNCVISTALEAGETLNVSAFSKYTSTLPMAGVVNLEDGYAYEDAVSTRAYTVGLKGSVWINELSAQRLEVCGSTNRVMSSGWSLKVVGTNGAEVCTASLGPVFDFTTNVINGVVGLDVRELQWTGAGLPEDEGEYAVSLVNSKGIVEHTVNMTFFNGAVGGMSGYAPWHAAAGYGYDWSGTATDGTFSWGMETESSFGSVNGGQGFNVPISCTLVVNTTEKDGGDISYATALLAVSDLDTGSSLEKVKTFQAVSEDGYATILITGESPSPNGVQAVLSGSAFGWACEEQEITLADDSVLTNALPFSPTVAVDGFANLGYWSNAGKLQWGAASVTRDGQADTVLRLNTYAVTSGEGVLRCKNYLSAHGQKMASIAFDFCNTINDYPYDEFSILIYTNADFSVSSVVTPALCTKRVEYSNGDWYRYQAVFALPEGLSEAPELWVELRCVSRFKTHSYTYVDNLRISFEDIVLPTSLARTVDAPKNGESSGFALDVVPQTTNSVVDVSADLHLILNGVTNVVPFAFADGSLTNEIVLVTNDVGEVQSVPMTLTAEALQAALGTPFLTGDEVTYFAAVHYDSANGATDPKEVRETRYFPDNATTSNEYWIVEGPYGVNADLSAQSFTVTGNPLSCIGTPEVTTEGVKFTLHGFDGDGISDLTVNVNGTDYHPFEGLDTNAQIRVTGEFSLPTGLSANTEYMVTISAVDALGNVVPPATFKIVTLPVVTSAKVEGVSTTEVKLTVGGNAAGYVVPAGWTQTSANTWKRTDGTPNTQFEATVYGTNKIGAASTTLNATPGYTLAAIATQAPAIVKDVTTVAVGADHAAEIDGNPAGTEYAVCVATNGVFSALVSTNGVPVWKPLAAWQQAPETVAEPTINLETVNGFSFVTRNFDDVESENAAPVTTNCWFVMESDFVGDAATQVANPFGRIEFSLVLTDPAQSANAMAEVEYKIGDGAWTSVGAPVAVTFDELVTTNSLVWDAWTAVGQTQGEYAYRLRARVMSGSRASEWAEISGTLDFAPPANLAIGGTPANGIVTKSASYSFDLSADDAHAIAYDWTLDGVPGTGASLSGGSVKDGVHTLLVTATDAMGNSSQASRTWTVDTVQPSDLTLSGAPAEGSVTSTKAISLSVSATDATALTYHWTFNGAESAGSSLQTTAKEGSNVVGVYAEDAAGNRSVVVTRTWTLDTTPPTAPTISGTPANGALTNMKAVNLVAASTDATALTYHWTFNGVTSTGTSLAGTAKEGANSVSVYATDAAGNQSAATSWSWTLDTVKPTVTLASAAPGRFNAVCVPLVVTVTFSEPVVDFTASSLTVGNGTVGRVAGSGKIYTVEIAPTSEGDVSVKVAAGAVKDAAGNGNTASTVLMRTYDTTKPTVTLASLTPARFNAAAAPLVVTATFSESVTNFVASSVAVVNGTVSTVTGSGTTYTIKVAPKAAGEVSVQIAADVVADEAGNGNTASLPLTRVYDNDKPTVKLATTAAASFNAAAAPLVVTATFSETVTNFTASSVTVGNGTVSAVSGTGNAYSFRVTPTAEGAVTVQIRAGAVADAAGNGNTASTALTRTYDTTAPTVELAAEVPDRFNADAAPVLVSVAFSESVTNFTATSVLVENGTVGEVSGSGEAYTVTIVPGADGDVVVQIPGGAVADAAGNGNVVSAVLTRTYDNERPTVALTSETPEEFNAEETFMVTATFSESVTNFTAASVSVENGTVESVTGEGAVYTFVVTPISGGRVSVRIAADVVADLAGNANAASEILARTYDTTRPTVELTSETPDPFNGNHEFTLTATFSEAVTNFTAAAIAVENGTVVADSVAGEGMVYTFRVTPIEDGEITVRIAADAVADAAGNGNDASSALTRKCDTTKPTVMLSSTTPNPFKTSSMSVTVTFSEAVTNFTAASVTVGNGTAGTVTGSGAVYTVSLAPTADGDVTVRIAADVVADLAGNANKASEMTLTRKYDTTAPTVPVISGTPANGALTNVKTVGLTATSTDATAIVYHWNFNGIATTGGTLAGEAREGANRVEVYAEDAAGNVSMPASWTWTLDTTKPTVSSLTSPTPDPFNAEKAPMACTVTFSEPVTGFAAGSVAVVNGTVGGVSGSGAIYTFNVTPTKDGVVSVQIAAGAVTDAAGNANTAGTTLTRTYDTTKPTVTLTSATPESFNAATPMVVDVAFSEPVTGFTAGSVKVVNGTVGGFSGSGDAYVVTITPASAGEVFVQIVADAVTDWAGNGNAASAALVRTYDTTNPTVELASMTGDAFNAVSAPMVVTATFSEAVTNFTAASVTVGNGTVGEVSGSGAAYVVTINPVADGPVTVQIAANAVADPAGNGNLVSDVLTRVYDTTSPTVAISSATAGRFKDAPLVVTVTFSEAVTNVTVDAVTVDNGTVDEILPVEGVENAYTVSITPTEEGDVTVRVEDGVVADAAGNGNAAADPLTCVYDNVKPTVALATETPLHFNASKAPMVVTVAFSEAVTNFTAAALTVVNGTADEPIVSEEVENAYTVVVTPTNDGEVSVQVPAGVVGDLAGNENEASSTLTRVYDTVKPTVELTSDTPDPFNSSHEFTLTVAFSEAVTNFTAAALTVVNGTAAEPVASEEAENVYTVVVTPTENLIGTVSVRIAGDAVTDWAGNGNAESEIVARQCDVTKPTVVLGSSTANAFNAKEAFSVDVVFSESVEGFTATAVEVENGTVSTVSGSGSAYTMTIQPIADGPVTVRISANSVTDAAGNGNEASEPLSRTYDTTPPENVVISGTPANGATTSAKKFDLMVTADDVSGINTCRWYINGSDTAHRIQVLNGKTTLASAGHESLIQEGRNVVYVEVRDYANLAQWTKSEEYVFYYDPGAVSSSDVEFGGGFCVKVDPDTGKTNDVGFVAVDFKPGEDSTFTLSGFSASTQELTDFQMWFVVCDTLGGTPWYVKVDETARFDSATGRLTVTLPATAMEKDGEPCGSFFILGIDNKNSAE